MHISIELKSTQAILPSDIESGLEQPFVPLARNTVLYPKNCTTDISVKTAKLKWNWAERDYRIRVHREQWAPNVTE